MPDYRSFWVLRYRWIGFHIVTAAGFGSRITGVDWVSYEAWGWAPITTGAGSIRARRGMVPGRGRYGYAGYYRAICSCICPFSDLAVVSGGCSFGSFGWLPIGPSTRSVRGTAAARRDLTRSISPTFTTSTAREGGFRGSDAL